MKLSLRLTKKFGKRMVREMGLKILKQKGKIYYITPHKNVWCVRWGSFLFVNADILKKPGYEMGMSPRGFS